MQSLAAPATWTVLAAALAAAVAAQPKAISPETAAAPVVNAATAVRDTATAAVQAVKPAVATTAAAAVQALKPAAKAPIAFAPANRSTSATSFGGSEPAIAFGSESALRDRMKYEVVRWGGKPVKTLDEASRVLLAQAAAHKAGLHEVGLSYRDVYGVIEAETSWIPRTGASKDGTPNLGLAQFEPRTAKGLGVQDPSDPVQAVFGAALYMKEGAEWASRKLAGLALSPEQHAVKVREGVSIYYNLSIKGRNKWDGLNAAELPVETQRHIRNARAGAQEAAELSHLLRI